MKHEARPFDPAFFAPIAIETFDIEMIAGLVIDDLVKPVPTGVLDELSFADRS